MDKFIITGGSPLRGELPISGSKNAVLPVMAATLLTKGTTVIHNVPDLVDMRTMAHLLRILGAKVQFEDHRLTIDTTTYDFNEVPYELVKTMRASIYVLGPLLAKMGEAKVSLPGGCSFGPRPIDYHLRGLETLGATVELKHGNIHATCSRLKGTEIYLDFPSVGATCNLMMSAVLAEGTTVLYNCAKEPHIINLGEVLQQMGAKIQGVGTDTIKIEGVAELHPCECSIYADYIELGTFLIAGAITKGDLTLTHCDPMQAEAVINKLRRSGYNMELTPSTVRITCPRLPKAVNVTTMPYPGFPTDMQAQFMALMSVTPGTSMIAETVFQSRFNHAMELNRLGANIHVDEGMAVVYGVDKLSGAPVMASDLRASAALVLAGLVAEGETHISRVYHIDRGYESIETKLNAVGASIQRVADSNRY
ncbi:MAG: UDP-N-acetylglucosamine 1-carboxyvinyltransferase [Gemmatimonadetes bacterium]|nr:MAG: UDP-N-acetylglucosamine 1-carboxyvinyltransferase [Gemmatimonadota bacterium]